VELLSFELNNTNLKLFKRHYLPTINALLELYLFNFVGYVGNTKQGNVRKFLIQLFKPRQYNLKSSLLWSIGQFFFMTKHIQSYNMIPTD